MALPSPAQPAHALGLASRRLGAANRRRTPTPSRARGAIRTESPKLANKFLPRRPKISRLPRKQPASCSDTRPNIFYRPPPRAPQTFPPAVPPATFPPVLGALSARIYLAPEPRAQAQSRPLSPAPHLVFAPPSRLSALPELFPEGGFGGRGLAVSSQTGEDGEPQEVL